MKTLKNMVLVSHVMAEHDRIRETRVHAPIPRGQRQAIAKMLIEAIGDIEQTKPNCNQRQVAKEVFIHMASMTSGLACYLTASEIATQHEVDEWGREATHFGGSMGQLLRAICAQHKLEKEEGGKS